MSVALTDRGGFTNLNQTYPEYPYGEVHGQDELNLRLRAYKGAWLNNAESMFFFNVSNPHVGKYDRPFTYMSSHIGKRFYLQSYTTGVNLHALQMSLGYGAYILGLSSNFTGYGDPRSYYRNPFRISSENFESASILCSGAWGGDLGNITNVGVACGLMFGAATRTDGKDSLVFTPGSSWRQPIYSCATALKADIKQVTFRWNPLRAETNALSMLEVKRIRDKTYKSQADEPYWAVENLHRPLAENHPLW